MRYGWDVDRRGAIDLRLTGLSMFRLRNSRRQAMTFLLVLPRDAYKALRKLIRSLFSVAVKPRRKRVS
jgi:hypothetical protein